MLLGDAAQKKVLLPQPPEPVAQIHRLIDGGMDALHSGGDEEGVKAHLPGDGVGDHVADHHAVASLLEPLQRVGHLLCAVHREDVQIKIQQGAQDMRRFRDTGKAHDGIKAGIVLRQLDGAQHIVDGD